MHPEPSSQCLSQFKKLIIKIIDEDLKELAFLQIKDVMH
jgi:hypothetical protein